MSKKYFWSLLTFMMVAMLSVGFTACGSDDDEDGDFGATELVGTWTVVSTNDEEIYFTTVSFKKDGTMSISDIKSDPNDSDPWEPWSYMRYTVNGNSLRIDIGEGSPDDSLIGTFTISGSNATYTYHYADYNGKWEDSETYTMRLTKK